MTRRSVLLVVLASVLLASTAACSRKERLSPSFAGPRTVARVSGVHALAVDGGDLYFGVSDTGEVYKVNARKPGTPTRLGAVAVRAQGANGLAGLAVRDHELFVSYVRPDRTLVVERFLGRGVVWAGPKVNSTDRVGQIAFDPDGALYVSLQDRIVRVTAGAAQVVSAGWVNPVAFGIDTRDRMFVADQAPTGGRARVARGREADEAKRRRFATGLPEGSRPGGLAFARDDVLVCRANAGDVYRLRIGLDNVARRREPVKNLKCRNALATMADGSLVTALAHEIRRYPPA